MERLPKKNLTAKVIALIMAIILWVYVMNEQNPLVETSMEIPLEVRNLSSSIKAADIPEAVRVRVRGPRALIVGLVQKDIKAYIDLKGLGDGRNTLSVATNIPTNVELVEVSPSDINFRLDTIISHQVPVEAKIVGAAGPGGVVSKITYSSQNITVKGPSEMVDTVVKAVVDVDLAGKNADFTTNGNITLLDARNKKVEGLGTNPGDVSVTVAFAPVINKKMVEVKPNIVGVVPKGVVLNRITITPEQIEISGDEKTFEKIQFLYTEPIDIAAIDKETVVEVKLQIKEGVLVTKNTVSVNINATKQ
jgi:YbbR domain-containing protein